MNLTNKVANDGLNEAELMIRAGRGNGLAWEGLMARYQESVFRLAFLMLGDAAEAEDIAQETFVRALAAINRFDPSRPVRPWLLHITANLARNRRRSLGRYLAALKRFLFENPAGGDDVAESAGQSWRNQTLWQAIQQLSPAGQEIIYLRYFLNLSEAEMAETLSIAPGTVKSRLHRALASLQRVIEQDFPALIE